jgi:hypothetical protein
MKVRVVFKSHGYPVYPDTFKKGRKVFLPVLYALHDFTPTSDGGWFIPVAQAPQALLLLG